MQNLKIEGSGKPGANPLPLPGRFWTYLQERFPLPSFVLMSLVFSLAGLSLSSSLRLGSCRLSLFHCLAAMLTTVFLFFQLRVIDEHKDRLNDARYLPERPVPRGLISLKELSSLAIALMTLQLAFALLAGKVVVLCLFASWVYMWLMGREFFLSSYLKERPILYMLSHMLIMLFVDLLITSYDFGPSNGFATGLLWFFAASFMSGMVVEFGRKIVAPECEREGIVSYSGYLGLKQAALWLALFIIAAQVFLTVCLSRLGPPLAAGLAFLIYDLFCFTALFLGLKKGGPTVSKVFAALSNMSVLFGYLVVLLNCTMHSGVN